MGRPTKEYQAFTSMVDKLLTVPRNEIVRRIEAEKAASAANPRKRGPKPKVKTSDASHDAGE
jgi:hypothetical protein